MEPVLVLIRALYFGISLGALAFFLLWEDGRPRTPFASTGDRNRHVLRNLVLFAWVIVIADYVVGQGLLHTRDILTDPPRILFDGASLPLPLQILAAFVASDLLGYWLHRAAHRFQWFWRLHAVHHSDPHLDATTAGRTHPLEISLDVVAKIALYLVLGLPFWLEGLRAIVHNAVAMVQHANVVFPPWVESLRSVFVTPALHRVHHDTDPALHGRNLGVIFSFWDRMFGTHVRPEAGIERPIGLDGYAGTKWQSVTGMLLSPFYRQP